MKVLAAECSYLTYLLLATNFSIRMARETGSITTVCTRICSRWWQVTMCTFAHHVSA